MRDNSKRPNDLCGSGADELGPSLQLDGSTTRIEKFWQNVGAPAATFQFTISHVIWVTVAAAVLFATGRTIAIQSWSDLVMLAAVAGFVVASWYYVARDYRLSLDMLLSVYLATVASYWLEYSVWHSISLALGIALLVYSVAVWLGATVQFELHCPSVGISLYLLLIATVWWGNFGPFGNERPVTMMLPMIAAAPFLICVAFRSAGLD